MSSTRIVYHQGDHVCALYSTPEEQLRAAIEYIRGGLERGERCLYICGEHPVKEFREALRRQGVRVEEEEDRGALILCTKHQAHLLGGAFNPDQMISLLARAVKDALAAGFTGLCAGGDMNWLLDEAPGSERVAEYEARLNEFYRSNKALGLCLYNRTTLPGHLLDHGMATHRHIRIDGPILLENPFYESDEEAMQRRAASPAAVAKKLKTLDGISGRRPTTH